MKRTLPFGFFVVLASLAFAQPDFKKITADLGHAPRQHPYLIFTAEEKPAMLERIKSDRKLAEIWQKTLLEGRRVLHATVQREAPKRELHTRFIGADDYRRYNTRNLEAAFTLAFLYQMTGDTGYVQKAFEYADLVCAQESWVQSAHYFEIIYPRVWPYGARDDQVVFSYDITASGATQKLAYIYDWLYPALSKAQRDRIRGALLEKAITRVRGSYEYHWWATAYKCNWSGICHTGLGLAALALLNEDPQLVDVIARSCEGVWSMLEQVGEDGGWQEGRGYWAYGVGESMRFAEAVRRATRGQVDFFKHRSVHPRPVDFALFGMTGAFGDGTGYAVGESFVINKLAQESGNGNAAWYAQNFVRPLESVFDLIWTPTTVKPEKPAEASKLFASIDWAVLRKDFGSEFMTIATKAGMNDDPHHGHLDCGTFNLTWHNLTYVGEVPRTPYDEKFFGEMRWDYLEANTDGHNVVTVNGEPQLIAKLKDQPWQKDIGGKITGYASVSDWAYVMMDPTKAYAGKELKRWNRSIVLDKARNVTIVLDQVNCAPGAQIEVRFHPGVDVDVGADRVLLRGSTSQADARARAAAALDRGTVSTRVTAPEQEPRSFSGRLSPASSGGARRGPDLEMLPLANGPVSLVQGRHPAMQITEEPRLSWHPYFSSVLKAPAAQNVIASVFVPSELKGADGSGAKFTLGTEGNSPAIFCTIAGKTTKYVFSPDKVTRTDSP